MGLVYEPMLPDNLQEFQRSLSGLLDASTSSSQCEDITKRIQPLLSQLEAGKIAPCIQVKLMDIAKAISDNDRLKANRELAMLTREHWDQHKNWLIGMKRLLLTC